MKIFYLIGVLLLIPFIFFFSHLPQGHVPMDLHMGDKVPHILLYGLLGWLGLSVFRGVGDNWGRGMKVMGWPVILSLLLVMVVGAADELSQPYFGRSCTLGDWLANLSGAIVATMTGIGRRRKVDR